MVCGQLRLLLSAKNLGKGGRKTTGLKKQPYQLLFLEALMDKVMAATERNTETVRPWRCLLEFVMREDTQSAFVGQESGTQQEQEVMGTWET